MHIFMNEVKDDLMTRKFLLDIRTKQKKIQSTVDVCADKTCDLLKKTERDEDDYLDIQSRDAGRAANAARGVYVIPDVPQSGESHLFDTTQVQVKGQWPVVGEELPVQPRDDTNECTPDKNTSEGRELVRLTKTWVLTKLSPLSCPSRRNDFN